MLSANRTGGPELSETTPISARPSGVRATVIDRWCLSRLASAFAGAPIRLQLWDGTSRVLAGRSPVGTVRIHDRATLFRLLKQADLAFGEGYTAGRITVDGDLPELLTEVNRTLWARWPVRPRPVRQASSTDSARHNVHAHYDIGNDFYQLWLDEQLVYTCAYYERPGMTLDQAQRAKLDYVCRKVRLRPGDRVVEAGCGWGALALHMARHYGVTVRAYNVSAAQLDYARERARREGLADRVQFQNGDYRSIDGNADVFVSVGMLEHVGTKQYRLLGGVIDRVLDPERGRGLLHFIGRDYPRPLNAWTTRYIFPGTYTPALSEVAQGVFEGGRLVVNDVENLRAHYEATLRDWLARFEAHADRVRRMFDDTFVRTWRLYLATAISGFASGDLQLYQMVFGRPLEPSTPWTRHALYEAAAHDTL
jgi:cyclopropane-fatty-acyl-phospholipid synthase